MSKETLEFIVATLGSFVAGLTVMASLSKVVIDYSLARFEGRLNGKYVTREACTDHRELDEAKMLNLVREELKDEFDKDKRPDS